MSSGGKWRRTRTPAMGVASRPGCIALFLQLIPGELPVEAAVTARTKMVVSQQLFGTNRRRPHMYKSPVCYLDAFAVLLDHRSSTPGG